MRQRNGMYVQPRMAYAILKYGWDDVTHEILFEGLTKEEAEQKETELISSYKSNLRGFGYNIENGGHVNKTSEETKKKLSELLRGRPKTEKHKKNLSKARKGVGHPLSEETKRKLSVARMGHPVTEESRRKMSEARKGKYSGTSNHSARKVVQYTKDGDFVKVWDYATQASDALSIHLGNLIQCCRGNLKSCGGFIWRYFEETGGDIV
jgi:group I intron endonuclease